MKPTSTSNDNEFRASGCFFYGGVILLTLAIIGVIALAQGVPK